MRKVHLVLALGIGSVVAGGLAPWHAAAQGTTRYVTPFGVDSGDCSVSTSPCQTITYALSQANQTGDAISLGRGTYQEQVLITKSVTVTGAGENHTTILAPTSLNPDSRPEPQTYIVGITNDGVNPAPAVSMSALSVAGPGPAGGGNNCAPNSSSLDKGIEVYGGASLALSMAEVRDIYDRPTSGCQRGDAISVGTACFSCTADTGTATLSHDIISNYQKNGVSVRGTGSTLTMSGTSVLNTPNPTIGSNGIEILNGALAQVTGGTVSGNECNIPTVCGPDPATQVLVNDGSGILVFGGAAGGSFVKKTVVTGNDMGLYTDSAIKFTSVNANNNRYIGAVLDKDATNVFFTSVTANSTGTTAAMFGFYVLSGGTNRLITDVATGNTNNWGTSNTPYDMYAQVSGHDNNLYSANTCTTGFPSRTYFNCA